MLANSGLFPQDRNRRRLVWIDRFVRWLVWLNRGRWRFVRIRLFRFIRRKILFVDVRDLNFRPELAVTTEQNIVARLLSLHSEMTGQFNDCARRQQV